MADESDAPPEEQKAVERAFGAANRRRIIGRYFADASPALTAETAWQHVYKLLLWINPTISLAHCYESDKCQPHKAWYPRSLAFHAWVSDQLGYTPDELHEHIDYLFREAVPDLASVEAEARREAAARHLKAYAGSNMPQPGDDPDLVEIILDSLASATEMPDLSEATRRGLVERVYIHFSQENKRKNLLGRGFEDTLHAIMRQLPGFDDWEIRTRAPLSEIPGFTSHGTVLDRAEVDLALWEKRSNGRRILATVKWSVRADRERQFDSDFDDYSKANSGGPFDYVLITNEFDAARLDAACSKVKGNQFLFTQVVHVEPRAVLEAYGATGNRFWPGRNIQAARVSSLHQHITTNRLTDFRSWLKCNKVR